MEKFAGQQDFPSPEGRLARNKMSAMRKGLMTGRFEKFAMVLAAVYR